MAKPTNRKKTTDDKTLEKFFKSYVKEAKGLAEQERLQKRDLAELSKKLGKIGYTKSESINQIENIVKQYIKTNRNLSEAAKKQLSEVKKLIDSTAKSRTDSELKSNVDELKKIKKTVSKLYVGEEKNVLGQVINEAQVFQKKEKNRRKKIVSNLFTNKYGEPNILGKITGTLGATERSVLLSQYEARKSTITAAQRRRKTLFNQTEQVLEGESSPEKFKKVKKDSLFYLRKIEKNTRESVHTLRAKELLTGGASKYSFDQINAKKYDKDVITNNHPIINLFKKMFSGIKTLLDPGAWVGTLSKVAGTVMNIGTLGLVAGALYFNWDKVKEWFVETGISEVSSQIYDKFISRGLFNQNSPEKRKLELQYRKNKRPLDYQYDTKGNKDIVDPKRSWLTRQYDRLSADARRQKNIISDSIQSKVNSLLYLELYVKELLTFKLPKLPELPKFDSAKMKELGQAMKDSSDAQYQLSFKLGKTIVNQLQKLSFFNKLVKNIIKFSNSIKEFLDSIIQPLSQKIDKMLNWSNTNKAIGQALNFVPGYKVTKDLAGPLTQLTKELQSKFNQKSITAKRTVAQASIVQEMNDIESELAKDHPDGHRIHNKVMTIASIANKNGIPLATIVFSDGRTLTDIMTLHRQLLNNKNMHTPVNVVGPGKTGHNKLSSKGQLTRNAVSEMLDKVIQDDVPEMRKWKKLLLEQIKNESGFNSLIRGSSGELGLAQFMPGTWEEDSKRYGNKYGTSRSNPMESIRLMALRMNRLLKKYNGDAVRALRAYNAGEGAEDSGKAKGYSTTSDYVKNHEGVLQPLPNTDISGAEQMTALSNQMAGSYAQNTINYINNVSSPSSTNVSAPQSTTLTGIEHNTAADYMSMLLGAQGASLGFGK
jgi:hypothetical protein